MTTDHPRRPIVTRARCAHCKCAQKSTLTIGVGARCHVCHHWSQWWQVIGKLRAPTGHVNTSDPEEDL
jgi:hypothetical protein